MYVMLLVGMVLSALVFGALLTNYTPGRLIQVIQGSAVVTVALNLTALWKQEARDRNRAREMETAKHEPFSVAWRDLTNRPGALRLLVLIGLGTFGFGMTDVLLEPYGGQTLGFSVAQTTLLTAILATGTLVGFGFASRALTAGRSPIRLATIGAAIGIPGFLAIILSSVALGPMLFVAGTLGGWAGRWTIWSRYADSNNQKCARRPHRAFAWRVGRGASNLRWHRGTYGWHCPRRPRRRFSDNGTEPANAL